MHLYVITRAIKDRADRWVNDCLAQYFPYEYNCPMTGEKKLGKVQLAVRPIQLYELVYPESAHNEVLAMLYPQTWRGRIKPLLMGLRKILRCKPVSLKGIIPTDNFRRDNIEVAPVGIKKDRWVKFKDQAGNEFEIEQL